MKVFEIIICGFLKPWGFFSTPLTFTVSRFNSNPCVSPLCLGTKKNLLYSLHHVNFLCSLLWGSFFFIVTLRVTTLKVSNYNWQFHCHTFFNVVRCHTVHHSTLQLQTGLNTFGDSSRICYSNTSGLFRVIWLECIFNEISFSLSNFFSSTQTQNFYPLIPEIEVFEVGKFFTYFIPNNNSRQTFSELLLFIVDCPMLCEIW